MSFNGSGTFLINSTGQPVVANTVISATVFNALTADLASGLTNCITKDGQSTPTANIPMGSNKITGLANGTLASDAANLGQVQTTAAKLITSVSGVDTVTGIMSPTLTAYAAGQLFYFVAAGANTGAVTLNIDGLGAKAVTRDGSTALAAGDINSGEMVVVIYDGTRFQMINAANSFGNTTINGTLTVTGNTGLQANVSITSTLSVGGTFAVTGAATLGSTLAVTGKSDLPTVSTASINAAVAVVTTGTVTNLTSTSASIASVNAGVALLTTATVTNLTASGASIASANIGNLQFTAASIASINAGVAVVTNLTATSASIASANVGTAVVTTGTVTNLTSTSASIASANAAVALVTTGTVTNLTSTAASIASANLGTAVISSVTLTGASIASVNIGNAVITGASIASMNGAVANITTVNATTVDATNVEVTNVKAKDGTAAIAIADSTGAVTVSTPTVVSVNSSSDALRITQVGAGNALVVEDSANPDATPFVITADGRVITGATASYASLGATPNFQLNGIGVGDSTFAINSWRNSSSSGGLIALNHSKSGTTGTFGSLVSGDSIGSVIFSGDDGVAFIQAASISAAVDGTPGTGDMPGRLVFSTTADGASTPTERMRIDNAGNIGINGAADAYARIAVKGTAPSSGGFTNQFRADATIPSSTTTSASNFASIGRIQAASFTLPEFVHYNAVSVGFGAGSTVTNQFGFVAANTLTGATNNYGFYSNIASGTNRWNFYANGTADNYFGGPTTISVNSSSAALRVTQTGTGNALLVEDAAGDASPFVINASGNTIVGFSSAITTRVATTSVTPVMQAFDGGVGGFSTFRFSGASASPATQFFAKSRSGTTGTTGTVVVDGDGLMRISAAGDDGTQFTEAGRIEIQVDGTPGTNDMPGRLLFSTTADGAATPTEKMRIDNAGNVVVNTAAIATTATNGFLYVPSCAGTPTGTPTTYTGRVPIVVDTTNHKLYFYSGGTWRDAGP